MKQIIILVFLIISLISIAKAGCKSDIDFTLRNTGKSIEFNLRNKGSKFIRITRMYVNDADGDKIVDIRIKKSSKSIFSQGLGRTFIAPKKTYSREVGNKFVATYGKRANYECKYQKPYENSASDTVGNAIDSVGDAMDDLNPLNYFKRRKECQNRADRADTVAQGKRIYKNCMENG